jgi:hypothetical protein
LVQLPHANSSSLSATIQAIKQMPFTRLSLLRAMQKLGASAALTKTVKEPTYYQSHTLRCLSMHGIFHNYITYQQTPLFIGINEHKVNKN